MAPLPLPPAEVAAHYTPAGSAPKFVEAIEEMMAALAGGRPEKPLEWLRTEARQTYLYGFGREYDDGRGKVTGAQSALYSHHGFGLGVDVVEKDATPWDAPDDFWRAIAEAAEATGRLKSGYRWKKPDRPHVYWAGMPDDLHGIEGQALRALAVADGIEAVWAKVGAA